MTLLPHVPLFHKYDVRRQMRGQFTWTHTEDLLKVSADAHLLVQLGRLSQVGAGFKVRHREDIGSTFTGGWKRKKTSVRLSTRFSTTINERI